MSDDQPFDDLPPRYEHRGVLGRGGMGTVHRVLDRDLERTVAMKVVLDDCEDEEIARFREEAQVSAQLEHPGIVPAYDIGRTPSGRLYFTMQEVRGRTLHEEMKEALCEATEARRLGVAFHRLMEKLQRVCEAVAYAHARGVVHRDLKPHNVMVGAFGEVQVLDWGLAKVLGRTLEGSRLRTVRSSDDSLRTVAGSVGGTPSYMSPEQARGDNESIDARSDVWSLGVILYQSLTGHRPVTGKGNEVLDRLVSGVAIPPPAERQPGWPIPEDLAQLAMSCLSFDPSLRPSDASQLASVLGRWLDGAHRQRTAMEHVASANALQQRIASLRESARRWRQRGRELLAPISPDAPEQARWPGWEADDHAAQVEEEVARLELAQVRTLRDALLHDPDLPVAHARLAELFREAHGEAERAGRRSDARRLEVELRAHDRGQHAEYLRGVGKLTLRTDPPDVEARLFRVREAHRRSEASFDRHLGRTPIVGLELPMGSWIVELTPDPTNPGHRIRYPILLHRGDHWDTDASPTPTVALPRAGQLDADDIYVPAGWALVGDTRPDRYSLDAERRWVAGFVIRRHPFLWGELLRLLNHLETSGRRSLADELTPRTPNGDPLVARQEGSWSSVRDPDGWLPTERHPVVGVTAWQADAIARAEALRTGQPWRLPDETEWEKAARGADGRIYPWGDVFDSGRAFLRHAWAESLTEPPAAGAMTSDVSLYGVRDLAGGYRDWTRAVDDSAHVLRGGAWNTTPDSARAAYRWSPGVDHWSTHASFRLARSWPEQPLRGRSSWPSPLKT